VPLGGQSGKSVGVGGIGVPKWGVRHTGNNASAPFAREKPPPPHFGHRSRKSGGGEASRPKASLSPGVGSGGVGGQRLHLAKSVLGGQSGEGRAKASPSLRWPVGGQSGRWR
jgi:hypothetical protein